MKKAAMSAALRARREGFLERAFFFFLLGASATGGVFLAGGGAGGKGLNARGSAGAGRAASGLIGSGLIAAGSIRGSPATGEGGSCAAGWWYGDVGLDGATFGAGIGVSACGEGSIGLKPATLGAGAFGFGRFNADSGVTRGPAARSAWLSGIATAV